MGAPSQTHKIKPLICMSNCHITCLGYQCSGYATAWSKCQYVTADVARADWRIPKSLRDDNDFLSEFKFRAGRKMLARKKAPEVVMPPTPAPAATMSLSGR